MSENNLNENEQRIADFFNNTNTVAYSIGMVIDNFQDMKESEVKSIVNSLVENNHIMKFGQKRGTKYTSNSFDPKNETKIEKDPQFVDEIIQSIQKLGARISLKKISEDIGEEANNLRTSLKYLIENGRVLQHGKKKGTCYSLPGFENDVRITENNNNEEKESKNNKEIRSVSDTQDYSSLDEFFADAVLMLPQDRSFDVVSISRALIESLPGRTVMGESVDEYEATKFVGKLVQRQELIGETTNDNKLLYKRVV